MTENLADDLTVQDGMPLAMFNIGRRLSLQVADPEHLQQQLQQFAEVDESALSSISSSTGSSSSSDRTASKESGNEEPKNEDSSNRFLRGGPCSESELPSKPEVDPKHQDVDSLLSHIEHLKQEVDSQRNIGSHRNAHEEVESLRKQLAMHEAVEDRSALLEAENERLQKENQELRFREQRRAATLKQEQGFEEKTSRMPSRRRKSADCPPPRQSDRQAEELCDLAALLHAHYVKVLAGERPGRNKASARPSRTGREGSAAKNITPRTVRRTAIIGGRRASASVTR